LTFANARSGLTGGSAAIDNNQQLQKDYTQGLLQASQAAQTGTSALEQSDINAKNQLIGLAQQGNLTGAVPSLTAAAQNASLGAAQSAFAPGTLANAFQATSGIWGNEQTAAAIRTGQQDPFGSNYGSSAYTGGGSSSPGPSNGYWH